jgi:hypothetical protein
MTPITQISCLMPTADRRAFDAAGDPVFSGAGLPGEGIDNWVDDGADSVADLVPDDPRVRD